MLFRKNLCAFNNEIYAFNGIGLRSSFPYGFCYHGEHSDVCTIDLAELYRGLITTCIMLMMEQGLDQNWFAGLAVCTIYHIVITVPSAVSNYTFFRMNHSFITDLD